MATEHWNLYTKAEIVAYKIDKYNNNLTPPPSPSVKRSSHLWRDMMGVLRRKDSTAASNVALANALNNNRVSCPTGGSSNGSRSPSISILRHHRYYYSEVGEVVFHAIIFPTTTTRQFCCFPVHPQSYPWRLH